MDTHKHTNASPSPRAIKYKLIPFCASKLPWLHTAEHFKRMLRALMRRDFRLHWPDDVSKHSRNRWRASGELCRDGRAHQLESSSKTPWQLPCIFQAADSLSRGKKKKKSFIPLSECRYDPGQSRPACCPAHTEHTDGSRSPMSGWNQM